MTNIEKLNEQGKLAEFVLDYAKSSVDYAKFDLADYGAFNSFKRRYNIDEKEWISTWLLAEVEESTRIAPGTRVKKTYTRMKDNAPFVIYGTVTQVINDTKGEHILVEWDDIESFKTMEVIGQDSVEVVEE